jgi:uncharacterized protein (DUF2147 family)
MIAFVIAAGMAAAAPAARAADPVIGTWRNRKGTVVVATRYCGRNLCGRVVWAAPEAQEKARAGGTQNLVGTEVLRGLQPTGQGQWSGEVFVPDLGQSAEAQLTMIDAANFQIDGCQYGGLLCKQQQWHKVRAAAGR